jgi:hypothetical protein
MHRLLSHLIFATYLFFSANCLAKTVEIPIRLDYPLLQSLITNSFYTGTEQTAQLVNEGDGCVALTLSHPRFSGDEGVLYYATDVSVHAGTPFGESCLLPFTWNGSIKATQLPSLDSKTWQLTFQTLATTLYSEDGQPVEGLNVILERMLPFIDSHLQDFSVSLTPPIEDLKAYIFPLFNRNNQEQAEMFVRSIRPGDTSVSDQGITVAIHGEITELTGPEESSPPEMLTEEELASVVELWETWDSLLTFLVSLLTEQVLTDSEKQLLIDLLLDTRHQFVTKINDKTVQNDFVREQFIHGWKELSPLFRRHLLNKPVNSELGYLSFFTAADALLVLDNLGPAVGIEISRDGFIRLARMLGGDSLELHYQPNLNEALQDLFEVKPEPAKKEPENSDNNHSTREVQKGIGQILLGKTLHLFFPAAFASNLPSYAEISKWKVPRDDVQPYLERVLDLLNSAGTSVVAQEDVPATMRDFYGRLIPAIAWQESCFRQFVVRDQKLTYLLSYNRSSVGIMQVNERVWRGIYDRQRLRWDIAYNAKAGCEIAGMYLQKYALRKATQNILSDEKTLAQLVYAMYNGGPSQYPKFLERKERGELYESDRLFVIKYDWVKSKLWDNLDKCL